MCCFRDGISPGHTPRFVCRIAAPRRRYHEGACLFGRGELLVAAVASMVGRVALWCGGAMMGTAWARAERSFGEVPTERRQSVKCGVMVYRIAALLLVLGGTSYGQQ